MQELIAETAHKGILCEYTFKVTNIHALANDAEKIGVTPNQKQTHPALDCGKNRENHKIRGLANRYRTLFEEFKGNRIKVIFKIFEEILSGDLGNLGDRSKGLNWQLKNSINVKH